MYTCLAFTVKISSMANVKLKHVFDWLMHVVICIGYIMHPKSLMKDFRILFSKVGWFSLPRIGMRDTVDCILLTDFAEISHVN